MTRARSHPDRELRLDRQPRLPAAYGQAAATILKVCTVTVSAWLDRAQAEPSGAGALGGREALRVPVTSILWFKCLLRSSPAFATTL